MNIEQVKIKASLHEAIEKWIEQECNQDYWDVIGYVHGNISGNMTDAAFAVLESTKELNEYFINQGLIKQ